MPHVSVRLGALLAGLASPAFADAPKVASDIPPVHSLVAQVMDGIGAPELIVRPGASPHAYALRPSDAGALETADVVVWIGHGLTPWLARPIETLAADAQRLELAELEGTVTLPLRDTAEFEVDDHGHDHGHGHDETDVVDPHLWLDPVNASRWLAEIGAVLAALDPENADRYAANVAAGQTAIEAAMQDVDARVAPVRDQRFVVYHDAYQYFEERFGLSAAGAIALSDATNPSAARVAEIQALVAAAGVTCVFAEPQFSDALVANVFGETSAKTAVIDPLGTDLDLGPALYPEMIRRLGREIATCLY